MGGCSRCVCVCVCTLDGLNAEHKLRVWVTSLSHILEIFNAKPGTIYLRSHV